MLYPLFYLAVVFGCALAELIFMIYIVYFSVRCCFYVVVSVPKLHVRLKWICLNRWFGELECTPRWAENTTPPLAVRDEIKQNKFI